MLFYFNMPNTQEIPACPSDSVLPLLPTAAPLTGQTGSCHRGRGVAPLQFQGDQLSKTDPAGLSKQWTLAWGGKKAAVLCGNLESLLSIQVWLF